MRRNPPDTAVPELRRSTQVAFRLRPHERELLESAARARRQLLTDLVRDASLERAREVLVGGV